MGARGARGRREARGAAREAARASSGWFSCGPSSCATPARKRGSCGRSEGSTCGQRHNTSSAREGCTDPQGAGAVTQFMRTSYVG